MSFDLHADKFCKTLESIWTLITRFEVREEGASPLLVATYFRCGIAPIPPDGTNIALIGAYVDKLDSYEECVDRLGETPAEAQLTITFPLRKIDAMKAFALRLGQMLGQPFPATNTQAFADLCKRLADSRI